MNFLKKISKILFISIFFIPIFVHAGNISTINKMAWGDKIGWINFGPDNGNVAVTDTAVTGYAWSANFGWINLAPTTSGVRNDGDGNLSGFAWGDKIGWVNFNGVIIDPATGIFSGQTTNTIPAGIINFSCDNCSVITEWRKATSTSEVISATSTNTQTQSHSDHSSGGSRIPAFIIKQPANLIDSVVSLPNYIYENFVPDFVKPKKDNIEYLSIEDYIKSTAPDVMSGRWDVFPHKFSDIYVLAPLPEEIKRLAVKFPSLSKIFNDVGINKITDLEKLRTANISLPNISEINKLPTEVVFVGNSMVNLSSTLQISDSGDVSQKIETIVNKVIKLSVKPISKADNVTGYLAFISRPQNVSVEISSDSVLASAIMAVLPAIPNKIISEKIENKMILSSFAYSDADADGVYTAEINAPQTEGEYEIITLIKYSNPELGTKEMRLITIVDPEGYVFEKTGILEARIPSAKVSIYKLTKNGTASDAVLWDAGKYNQENPQITDKTGKYSFLVPEGEYYIVAEASGYRKYNGEIFSVREGGGVHFNIELTKSSSWQIGYIDWKYILIIFMGTALIYNFFNERKMFKKIMESNNFKNIK
jgi:hypothetical protein